MLLVIHLSLILMVSSMKHVSIRAETFFVADYGAQPNDEIDDSNQIQSAVNAAIMSGLNSTIIFDTGVYNLLSTIFIFNASNLTIQGQGIGETFLVGKAAIIILFVQHCENLKIYALSIDYDPLPFTGGFVVHINKTYLDIEVQTPHRADLGRQVHSIFRYDPIQMRPTFGPHAYQIFQTPPVNANTSLVSPGILRIPLRLPTKFSIGDPIVAIYNSQNHAIVAHYTTDLTIQSISLFTSWFMGLFTLRARRLHVIDFHVKPHDGLWLSSNADCMHFVDAREHIHIADTKCQLTGDDGLNVHAVYFMVADVINSSALILKVFNWIEPINIDDGTHLEFSSHQQPFSPHETGKVASSIYNSTDSRLFIFTSPINVSVGDWAIVADTPSLTIRNFTVENNRGRGVLLETRNIDIRQSLFNRTSAPAVFFQPSMFWHEGPTARNVTLIENVYINCNEGISQHKGIILFLPDPIQLLPVIDSIRIESSTFYFGNFSQGLIQSNNANNVFISGNYIATNSSMPLVILCNSRNISASNNTVYNHQSKIEQYYTFDQTYPCQMNLSSLIDLPPSAFNSSFAPPVLISHSS